MAETYKLKHKGADIDALLDKAKTAVQPIPDGAGNDLVMADGIVTSDDVYYYFPDKAPANDPQHTFAMASDVQATDAKLTELSEETNLRFKESSESTKEQVASLENKANKKFASVDSEIENLKRGEAYVMGETLAFRNYADAKIQGNTLTL